MGAHSLRQRRRVGTLEDRLFPENFCVLRDDLAHGANLIDKGQLASLSRTVVMPTKSATVGNFAR